MCHHCSTTWVFGSLICHTFIWFFTLLLKHNCDTPPKWQSFLQKHFHLNSVCFITQQVTIKVVSRSYTIGRTHPTELDSLPLTVIIHLDHNHLEKGFLVLREKPANETLIQGDLFSSICIWNQTSATYLQKCVLRVSLLFLVSQAVLLIPSIL